MTTAAEIEALRREYEKAREQSIRDEVSLGEAKSKLETLLDELYELTGTRSIEEATSILNIKIEELDAKVSSARRDLKEYWERRNG